VVKNQLNSTLQWAQAACENLGKNEYTGLLESGLVSVVVFPAQTIVFQALTWHQKEKSTWVLTNNAVKQLDSVQGDKVI
jgi:hypothetical protein